MPFAGLALVLWPLIVVASALTAFLCSPFFGLYSAVVVYQVGDYIASHCLFRVSPKFHKLVREFIWHLLKPAEKGNLF